SCETQGLNDCRFRNLFGMLTVDFLLWCRQFVNRKAAAGVDRVNARTYEVNLLENISALVGALKSGWYRAKLVLRRYIPKLNGKLRPLGLPAIADKLLQTAAAKILEAIYEQDFLSCSYGCRPGMGPLDAVKDLTAELMTGRYHFIVEADIKGFFDNIDHELLLEMLSGRIDDKAFLNLIRKWLKAGILDTDGKILHPETGTPQGGTVSPILANIYLHYVLDVWFEEVVKQHCKGAAYLCRFADDFVCAFQYETDAQRFYDALGKRLGKFGLETAEEKTNLIRFGRFDKGVRPYFVFLGFEFKQGQNRWGRIVLKRRTSRKKYKASIAIFKEWCKDNCHLRKPVLFAKLNAKFRGYLNYYGVRGNYESVSDFFYQARKILFKWLNRRSHKKSYNEQGFKDLLKDFRLVRPSIKHSF
ncbi:MAG: group II intron reverse transcriptase/maturase, partial [Gammaproteobacteria bacterium]|nr:group II intron reverse transcriptase/maturase [Gammaproteobacteria bacterium]